MEDPGRCWRLPCPDPCSCPHGRGVSVLSPRARAAPEHGEDTGTPSPAWGAQGEPGWDSVLKTGAAGERVVSTGGLALALLCHGEGC